MAKSSIRDIPQELKEFWKVFERLIYAHDAATVFDDYLSMMINQFSKNPIFSTDCFNKYSDDERKVFAELLVTTVQTYNEQIVNRGRKWYDPYGDFYQYLAGRYKQSRLGQFFTPEPVVDLMVIIQGGDDLTGANKLINDPCSGSGRFPIAFHANYPGNYIVAEDIDPICCKMTCANMAMHGCKGEVIQHNSLYPEDYQNGWLIHGNGFGIQELPKEQSVVWNMWQRCKKEAKAENKQFKKSTGQQMSLFPM